MSAFSGLNTAYTGLVVARAGLDIVGQNIANANTVGYTRQRLTASAVGPLAPTGPFAGLVRPGGGVSVDAVARLGSLQLDARVRSSAAIAGYSAVRANTMTSLEGVLREPGEQGLAAQLHEFWAGWQDLSNSPQEPAPAAQLLEQAGVLTSQIARGYRETEVQWSQVRGDASGMVTEVNNAATEVAELNVRIRTTLAGGGNVNEMLDRRNTLTTTLAALTGGTVRAQGDGTVDVVIAGDAIVAGGIVHPLQIVGAASMNGAGGSVQVEWVHRAGQQVALDGGELAGALSVLAAANASGTGGAIAEAAASYNTFATYLATTVNDIHSTGVIADGTSSHAFFGIDAALPAALGLSVIPTSGAQIASGATGAGANDGSVADQISQLGVDGAVTKAGVPVASPNTVWSAFVTAIGVSTKTELQQASLSDLAATYAAGEQLANASVDLDEENVNLLAYQHAYQAAARVMTAMDDMLETLINRTGLVGR
jgi:flagellar hook-associated protein 1 FlgK